MRQVFSSPRLENVERVAKMLRDAGIETRITHGRSYKGNWRKGFSYRDDTREDPVPAVWVIQSDDQPKAREILREAGLLDSTRTQTPYSLPVFRSQDAESRRSPARRRAFLVKLALLVGIVVVCVMALLHGFRTARAPQLASPPFDGSIHATLEGVAEAVFAQEIPAASLPVLCYGVDGGDASTTMIDKVARAPFTSVPASHCTRADASEQGSVYPKTGQPALQVEVHAFKPSSATAGTIEFSAAHDNGYGYYKTFAVQLREGRWQVVRTLKHVQLQG